MGGKNIYKTEVDINPSIWISIKFERGILFKAFLINSIKIVGTLMKSLLLMVSKKMLFLTKGLCLKLLETAFT